MTTNIRFEEWEALQLQDPEYVAALEELEPAYQVARLRMKKGLTQKELAERVGTKQSSIARLESGKMQPRLSFLRRIVKALKGKIELHIYTEEEAETLDEPVTSQAFQVSPIQVNIIVLGSRLPYSTQFKYEGEIEQVTKLLP